MWFLYVTIVWLCTFDTFSIEARNCEPVVVASINPKKVKTQTIQYTNVIV